MYTIQQERLTPEAYIDFLRRTDLGSQYPKERFEHRIAILVERASISLTAPIWSVPRWNPWPTRPTTSVRPWSRIPAFPSRI